MHGHRLKKTSSSCVKDKGIKAENMSDSKQSNEDNVEDAGLRLTQVLGLHRVSTEQLGKVDAWAVAKAFKAVGIDKLWLFLRLHWYYVPLLGAR